MHSGNSTHRTNQVKEYFGLRNEGATCYLNSVLQVLFMTKDFRDATESFTEAEKKSVFSALKKLFGDLKSANASASEIVEALGINVNKQEDAAEYFHMILSSVDSSLSEIFMGTEKLTKTCKECKTTQKKFSDFFFVSLAFDHSDHLQDCFNAHFQPLLMNEENKLFCKSCNTMTDRKLENQLLRMPTVLVIQLKRFEWNPMWNKYTKNTRDMKIPSILNVQDSTYDLYAFVKHFGDDLSCGHYTADIKSFENQNWYIFDDNRVSPVQYKKHYLKSCNAYLIFYRCQTMDKAKQPTEDKKRKGVSGNQASANQGNTNDFNCNPAKVGKISNPHKEERELASGTALPTSELCPLIKDFPNVKDNGWKQTQSFQSESDSRSYNVTRDAYRLQTSSSIRTSENDCQYGNEPTKTRETSPEDEQTMPDTKEKSTQRIIQKQPTLPNVLQPQEKYESSGEAKKLNRCLVEYVCTSNLHVSTLESSGFRHLITTLLLTPPMKYEIPPLHYFLDSEIPDLYHETKNIVQHQLTQSLFLSCTNHVCDSCITVTLHCITESWEMQSWYLGSQSLGLLPTSERVEEALKKMMNMWKVDVEKISCITIDNAKVHHIAFESYSWIPCFRHSLSSALTKIVNTGDVLLCLKKLRMFVFNFTSSSEMTNRLSQKQSGMQLQQQELLRDDPMCWNPHACCEMIDCFLSQHQALCSIHEEVCRHSRFTVDDSRCLQQICHRYCMWYYMPTEREIKTLQDVRCILWQYRDVKGLLLSAVLPLMRMVSDNVTNADNSEVMQNMNKIIIDHLNSCYENKEKPCNIATFLDPRFKESFVPSKHDVKISLLKEFQKSQKNAQADKNDSVEQTQQEVTALSDLMRNLQISKKNANTKGAKMSVINPRSPEEILSHECDLYEKMEDISTDKDPLAWWSSKTSCLPVLANFARQYLCIAASCSSEQACSCSKYVCAPGLRVTQEHIVMYEFLSNNLTQAKKLT